MTNLRSLLVTLALCLVAFCREAVATELSPVVLWPDGAPGALGKEPADVPTLTPYLPPPGTATGGAVVVCPGGGYGALADHEGRPVAEWLNSLGIAGFVLKYRIAPRYHHPAPLQDAARAVRTVRARAAEWGVKPDRIGILGFSAGGHLASTAGTHFAAGSAEAQDPVERVSSRPDCMILVYPVITMRAATHAGSRNNLIGPNPDEAMVALMSNEEQVTRDTPPAFLIHTVEDKAVPYENSLLFVAALRKAGVPHEFHLYEKGQHGFGMASGDPVLSSWPKRCADWLRLRGFRGDAAGPPAPLPPLPTPRQIAWQESEMLMFLHFGINTFTDREWGEGTEDPRLFQPEALDARQWASVAKEAGFKYMILTAKHHDGFCLWPSRYTEHSVKTSPWKGGNGDVVREVATACREAGLELGIYLSPWDRHEKSYADSAKYDEHFKAQLTELLSSYGEVAEVWFDGAGSEGHVYDWPGYYGLIRKLQKDALIAICGPDVRWVENEDGVARETEWSVQPASPALHPGARDKVWYPAECDVSIRPGWFWHQAQDAQVKSLEQLLDIYYKSVGRNSVLLLNVPPNRRGLISEADARRLRELRAVIDATFRLDFALGKSATASDSRGAAFGPGKALDGDKETYWSTPDGTTAASLELDLGEPLTFNVSRIEEAISLGQRVEEYRVEVPDGNGWKAVVKGTTVGHKKLDRFPEVTAEKVRLVVAKARGPLAIRSFGLHLSPRS